MKYVLDVHMHSIASGHAYSTIKEYCDEARQKGLELIAITEHAPDMPGSTNSIYFSCFNTIKRLSDEKLTVMCGVELNISDRHGRVDLPERFLKRMDVAIASLHMTNYRPTSRISDTEAVINAIKNPYIKIIGHLGDKRYDVDYEAVVDAAVQYGVALEVNNSSFAPGSVRTGGEELVYNLICLCKQKNHPIILGSDSHLHIDVGNFDLVTPLIERAGMPDELILNTSKERFLNFLGRKK